MIKFTALARWSVALALAVCQVTAFAQGTANVTQYGAQSCLTTSNAVFGWYSDPQSACAASSTQYPGNTGWTSTAVVSGSGPYVCTWTQTNSASCSGGKTYTITTQAVNQALPCPSAGEQRTINFTTGYTEDPQYRKNATDAQLMNEWQTLTAAGSTCATTQGSTCTASITPDASNIKKLWISATPNAQGLYRLSADYTVTFTGTSCTPTTAQKNLTDTAATPATCNGTYGTVNGKPVCVPSSTATRNVVSAAGGGTTAAVGNPAAGSSGAVPLSSRVPAAGTGNNDGGPVTAIDGAPVNLGSPLPTTASSAGSSSSGGGSGITPSDLDNIKTDCDKYPSSVGCAQLGTPAPGAGLSQLDAGFGSITPVAMAESSGCPAPLTFEVMSSSYAVSYQPICDNAAMYIKPVVLVLAAFAAAFVFIGGFKT